VTRWKLGRGRQGLTKRKRYAWNNLDRGEALLEWELGSRVTEQLLCQNSVVPALRNGRLAMLVAQATPIKPFELIKDYVNRYIILKETDNVPDDAILYVKEVDDDGRLYCEQVWPQDIEEVDGVTVSQHWLVHPDLIESDWTDEVEDASNSVVKYELPIDAYDAWSD
jgi:hypothetical protein